MALSRPALEARLRAGPPLILDGATGTELERRGVATRLPLWSAGALDSHPDLVREIHADYVAAGVECDGQVLVMHDMLGLSDWTPSFVKNYAAVGVTVAQAARRFAEEVRERKFPDPEHSYR